MPSSAQSKNPIFSGSWVLLFHGNGRKPDHYDLMIEFHDVLKTWSFTFNPFDHTEISGVLNIDHPRKFLTYEGELSQGNGYCKRVDSGEGKVHYCADDKFRFELISKSGARFEVNILGVQKVDIFVNKK